MAERCIVLVHYHSMMSFFLLLVVVLYVQQCILSRQGARTVQGAGCPDRTRFQDGRDPSQLAALCVSPIDPVHKPVALLLGGFSYRIVWKTRTRSHRVNSYSAITSSSVWRPEEGVIRAKQYAHICNIRAVTTNSHCAAWDRHSILVRYLRRYHFAHNPNIECMTLHTLCLANVRSRAVLVSIILLGLVLCNKSTRELLCGLLECSKRHTRDKYLHALLTHGRTCGGNLYCMRKMNIGTRPCSYSV